MGSRVRVLLAEPHDDSREMYDEYLRAVGFDVIPVGSAEAALHESRHVDAIVTAFRFPSGIQGDELIRALRRRRAELPIVVVSACPQRHCQRVAIAAGANEYLVKPALPDNVEESIITHVISSRFRTAE